MSQSILSDTIIILPARCLRIERNNSLLGFNLAVFPLSSSSAVINFVVYPSGVELVKETSPILIRRRRLVEEIGR